MPALSTTLRWLGVGALVVGYPVLAHISTATSWAVDLPDLGACVSLAPAVAVLLWMTWNASRRLSMIGLCFVVGVALWMSWPNLRSNFDWLYYFQHVGTNLGLAAVFGLSLRPGRKPLISRLAETIRGDLTVRVAVYTRTVTWMWSGFFFGISVISTVLFFAFPIKTWSVFANFVTLPLALSLFAGEYLVRLRRLRDEPQHSFKDSLLAYWKTPGPRQSTANTQ